MNIYSHDDFPEIKIIENFSAYDERGKFIKTFNESEFKKMGIVFENRESYYSISNKDVIRGMHFQIPPYEHDKIIHVINGDVIDVIVDLRTKSMNYGKSIAIHLSGTRSKSIFIPKGFAHGFRCLENNTIMLYNVTSEYNAQCDKGILWNSIDYEWGISDPIITVRDSSFPGIQSFKSPF